MSNETLTRAESLLLELLKDEEAVAPADLLVRAAERRIHGLTAEDFRIALWSLLGAGVINRTEDNRVRRSTADRSGARDYRPTLA